MPSRKLRVLRGEPTETLAQARALLADFPVEGVLWIGEDPPFTSPRQVQKLLGRTFDAVVIDQHATTDVNVMGQSHGFIRGGGVLVLRRPTTLRPSPFERRLERILSEQPPPQPVEHAVYRPTATVEQDKLVDRLSRLMHAHGSRVVVIAADRGRGKSAAIGRALATLQSSRRAVLTARDRSATREVVRFAGRSSMPFVDLATLALAPEPPPYDIVVVEEAAQVPIPILRRLVSRYRASVVVMATTTHGYEGTGRGFTLRFVPRLRQQASVHLEELSLTAPIRWDAGDPLEAFMFCALMLDASPSPPSKGPYTPVWLDPSNLASARGARQLNEVFGLLIEAHYRTRPSDLKMLLDAPNVRVAALVSRDGHVMAANLIAIEGPLDDDTISAVLSGRQRLVGHALLDALIAHLARPSAGKMRVIRSVRLAVHPHLRRLGLATKLARFVHDSLDADLFGTLFGADCGVIAFRRTLGYEVVRLSASRGQRTGEPSVVMVRPVSERARTLYRELRHTLSQQLPLQLELFSADQELLLASDTVQALLCGLPQPRPISDVQVVQTVASYAFGPRTFESCAAEITRFVAHHQAKLGHIDADAAQVLRHRVLGKSGWNRTVTASGLPSHRAAMRALRRGVRQLLAATG